MKDSVLIGIDIGTTNIKFLAMYPDGHPIHLVVKKMRVDHSNPGWADFNIPILRKNLFTGLKELSHFIPNNCQVISIGVDSIGESYVGLDSQSKVITPCPTWFDRRTENYREKNGIPVSTWYNLTGMVDDDIYTIHRIIWFETNYPEIISKVKKYLWIADYAIYLLTDQMITAAPLACRTGLFDRNNLSWSPLLVQATRISEAMLPMVLPTASIAGTLSQNAAHLTNLLSGTPVVHAGHDHPCAVLGSSISTSGSVIDSTGTAEAVNTVIPECLDYERTIYGSYDCYPYAIPGLYNLSGHLPSSGALFDWIVRLVTGISLPLNPKPKQIEKILQEVSVSPAGAHGIQVLPFLEGSGTPWHQRFRKAEIRGLKSHHNRGDIVRAALEGVAVWFKINMEILNRIVGNTLEPIIAIGGGSKNKKWLEIKSAIVQKSIHIPKVEEAAAQGSAFIGGLAVKYYPDSNISKYLKNISWTTVEASNELMEEYQPIVAELTQLFEEVLSNK